MTYHVHSPKSILWDDQFIDPTPPNLPPETDPNLHTHWLANLVDVSIDAANKKEGQGLFYDAETGLWKNRAPFSEAWPTGLVDGGELNVVAGEVQVVGPAYGLTVNGYTNPLAPPVVEGVILENTFQGPITAAPAVAGSIVWIALQKTATPSPVPTPDIGIPFYSAQVIQYNAPPSPQTAREQVFLGVVIHNGTEWKEVSNPKVIGQAAETLREVLINLVGPTTIISGGAVSEQAGFTLNQDAGVVWEQNRNWHVDKANPNRESFPAATPIQFRYTNRDFSTVSALRSAIDPTQYDDNGTVVTVPGAANSATIQLMYKDAADNYWVLYGQEVFDGAQDAASRILPEVVVPGLLGASIFLGYIVVEKAKTDWDPDEAFFVRPGAEGGASGGGGGGGDFPQGSAEGQTLRWNQTTSVWQPNSSLIVLGSGNVGIGKTDPTQLLEIEGDPAIISLNNSAGGNPTIRWRSSGTIVSSVFTTASGTKVLDSNGSMVFRPGNVESVRFAADGNVGIGTDNPLSLLHVEGTNFGGTIRLQDDQQASYTLWNSDGARRWSIGHQNSTEALRFVWNGGTGALERMRIQSDGDIGIGTQTPEASLELRSTGIATRLHFGRTDLDVDQGRWRWTFGAGMSFRTAADVDFQQGETWLNVQRDGLNVTNINFPTDAPFGIGTGSPAHVFVAGRAATGGTQNIALDPTAEANLIIANDQAGNKALTIRQRSSGMPIIFQTFAGTDITRAQILGSGQFQVVNLGGTGNRVVYSDPNGILTNSASDSRLKHDIHPSVYGLGSVMSMQPVSFNWIDAERLGPQREIGFLAQQMQEIVPEVVGENHDGTLSLDYAKLVPVLVKAIQELKIEVEELRNGS